MRFIRSGLVLFIIAAGSVATHSATAAGYTFVKIADDTAGITNFDRPGAMNQSGQVAFIAKGASGDTVYRGSGGPLTTIYSPGLGLTLVAQPSINDSGVVAVGTSANFPSGFTQVAVGTASPPSFTNLPAGFEGTFNVDITNSGLLALTARHTTDVFICGFIDRTCVLTGPVGGSLSILYANAVWTSGLDANDSGDVAFFRVLPPPID